MSQKALWPSSDTNNPFCRTPFHYITKFHLLGIIRIKRQVFCLSGVYNEGISFFLLVFRACAVDIENDAGIHGPQVL